MGQTTTNSLIIEASQREIYEAITNPDALEIWQAPDEMTAKVHNFDLRVSGGYEMSLFYPDKTETTGKTKGNEDKFTSRFIELSPHSKIVQAVNFDTSDPMFSGEMIMEITLRPTNGGTNVTFTFKDIPVGIKPADNEAGTMSSLNKLAAYVRAKRS